MRLVEAGDFKEIATWFEWHRMPMPDFTLFPTSGIISPGFAAGFIYFTNSPVAVIDCLISNPNSNKRTRNREIDEVVKELIEWAYKNGARLIKCTTQNPNVIHRAESFGFKEIGQFTSMIKEF